MDQSSTWTTTDSEKSKQLWNNTDYTKTTTAKDTDTICHMEYKEYDWQGKEEKLWQRPRRCQKKDRCLEDGLRPQPCKANGEKRWRLALSIGRWLWFAQTACVNGLLLDLKVIWLWSDRSVTAGVNPPLKRVWNLNSSHFGWYKTLS